MTVKIHSVGYTTLLMLVEPWLCLVTWRGLSGTQWQTSFLVSSTDNTRGYKYEPHTFYLLTYLLAYEHVQSMYKSIIFRNKKYDVIWTYERKSSRRPNNPSYHGEASL